MLNTVVTYRRSLLCWLLCFFAAPLWAEDQRQWVTPGEIQSGLGLIQYSSGSPHYHTEQQMLSRDGRYLWYTTNKGGVLKDMDSGKMRRLGDSNDYWWVTSGLWSPVESTLAFIRSREGRRFLSLWSPESPAPARDLMEFPKRLTVSGHPQATAWSADGETLFLVIRQSLPFEKSHPDDDKPPTESHNVSLKLTKHFDPSMERPRFEKEYEQAHAEWNRSLIVAVDIATGKAGLLAKGNDVSGVFLSPDNRRLAVVQTKDRVYPPTQSKELSIATDRLGDIYLVDVRPVTSLPVVDMDFMASFEDRRSGWSDHKGRRMQPVLSNKLINSSMGPLRIGGAGGHPVLTWSPDSQRFAYATTGKTASGDLFVYDIGSAQLSNLTAELELSVSPKSLGYGEHYRSRQTSPKFGSIYPPLWLPDGQSLVVAGRGDAWRIPLSSKQSPKLLTKSVPQEVLRILPVYDQNAVALDEQGQFTFIAKDRQSRLDSLWTLSLKREKAKKLADTGVWVNPKVLIAENNQRLIYTGQTPQRPVNIYQVAAAGEPQTVTNFKPALAERRFPESRILSWPSDKGGTSYALLYLPREISPGKKAPMIVRGYPGDHDSRIDARAKIGALFYDDALHGLLQQGMAVLYPDIKMSPEGVYQQPMFQITEEVMAATDAALATGLIDSKRLGLMGASYGGYMVQAVVTQTDRFKTAVSIAGLSDLVGNYADRGDVGIYWSEIGQGRMGVAPWSDAARYTHNSPLAYFDNVKTPLLILHGDKDPRVSIWHSQKSFRALKHLDNPTVFATYKRMYHSANPEAHRRARLWFIQHLLGGKDVAGLADQGSFFLGGDLGQDELMVD